MQQTEETPQSQPVIVQTSEQPHVIVQTAGQASAQQVIVQGNQPAGGQPHVVVQSTPQGGQPHVVVQAAAGHGQPGTSDLNIDDIDVQPLQASQEDIIRTMETIAGELLGVSSIDLTPEQLQ